MKKNIILSVKNLKTEFVLDEAGWNQMMAILEKPPEPNEALRELFARPRPQ